MNQFKKQTDKALGLFKKAQAELVAVNKQIREKQTKNIVEIDKLHQENAEMTSLLTQNDAAVEELSKFIPKTEQA
ncbi:MAG: hypothetical protein ACQEUT_18460 [Bacillota bacterium]